MVQRQRIAEHPRHFGRQQTIYDPWHYLPVLARKPGALRNGGPFQDWALPAGLSRLRAALGNVKRHEMIEAFGRLGLKGMAAAYDEAVTTGITRNRTVMEILEDLFTAETAHRDAATIRYRLTAAKLPVMKDLSAARASGI